MSADPWVEHRSGRGRCAIAAHALSPGVVVSRFSGAPYAACILPSQGDRLCAGCLRSDAKKLLRCSKCKVARYCGSQCQRSDWPAHKHECATLAVGTLHGLDDAPAADILLVGRCLWRRHATTVTSVAEDASFDALEAADKVTESDLALGAFACSLPGLLPPSTSAEQAAALIAAFARNNFGVLNDMISVVGAGCFPAAALLNHSCAPNCVLAFTGSKLEIRTVVAVQAGEEVLCQIGAWSSEGRIAPSYRIGAWNR